MTSSPAISTRKCLGCLSEHGRSASMLPASQRRQPGNVEVERETTPIAGLAPQRGNSRCLRSAAYRQPARTGARWLPDARDGVAGWAQTAGHHSGWVTSAPPPSEAPESYEPPAGLSAFAAKVLDQMSLSAWLPAAFLALSLTMLVSFKQVGRVDIADAAQVVADDWLAFLLLALPTLVCVTLLTQATAFEAIRLLEGYWPHKAGLNRMSKWLIGRQLLRKEELNRKRLAMRTQAFSEARAAWRTVANAAVVDALEMAATEQRLPDDVRRGCCTLPSPKLAH